MNSADTLRQLINSQVISRLIYVVAKLGIADLLKNGPLSCDKLAKSVNANPSSLYRVLRTLASVGVFSETETAIFEQTQMSKLLESDVVGSQRAVAMLVWEPWWRQGWDQLLYSVETGKVGFNNIHGMGLFEYLSRNADASDLFNKAMAGNGRLLLIERVIPSGNVPSPGKIMDIVMMVNLGGLERTADEYEALLNDSGFKLTGIIPTGSAMSIIESVPD